MLAEVVALMCSIGAALTRRGRIPGMEAFVTPEPDHLKGFTVQPVECTVFKDALAGAGLGGAGDFESLWSLGAEVVDLAELLAET